MSAITFLTTLVQQAITRLNLIETNAKKVDELPHQTTLEPTSKIPVSRAGNSEHLTIQQVIDAVGISNYNQLLAIGSITIDGTDIEVASGVSGQINGMLYGTSAITTISIALCETGFNRKDILVLTTSNTVVSISGEETDGSIVIAPPTPIDAVYITTFDVSDTAIGTPEDPIIGTSFVKKSFFAPFVSTVTGADAIIPLDPNGYSEIRLTDASLTSIAGFDLSLITGVPTAEVPYNGKPYIIRNLTGNNITIKKELGAADFPFYLSGGTDLVFPNGQAIYLLYDASGFNEIFKSWSTSTTDISGKQDKIIVVSASGTASNDQKYHVIETSTFTDPASPIEGKGYEVFVRNGIATIGGVDYPVGSYLFRTYHSGVWGSQLIGGGTSLRKQSYCLIRDWSTTTLDRFYYISFNNLAVEYRPVGTNNTIVDSLTGRNVGMFTAPYNCKITAWQLDTRNTGSFTGVFGIGSGQIASSLGTDMTNKLVHLNQAITSAGFITNHYSGSIVGGSTILKGETICVGFMFSAQAQATKNGVTIQIEIEEVI